MIDVFKEVRERVSAEDAARHYGIEVKHHKALCPFHSERTPSLSFKAGRYHCFGCGAGGDSIDFTSRLLSLDPLGAVRELNRAFALCLPLDREPTGEERRAARRRRESIETRREFERWRAETLDLLTDAYREGYQAELYKSIVEMTDTEITAVTWLPALDYWIDLLANGTLTEQMGVFRDREGVKKRCQMILDGLRMKSETA